MIGTTGEAQTLSIWTIYDHPLDYPQGFIARRWVIQTAGDVIASNDIRTADSLDEVRQMIPAFLHRLPRQDGDDPKIVESWI